MIDTLLAPRNVGNNLRVLTVRITEATCIAAAYVRTSQTFVHMVSRELTNFHQPPDHLLDLPSIHILHPVSGPALLGLDARSEGAAPGPPLRGTALPPRHTGVNGFIHALDTEYTDITVAGAIRHLPTAITPLPLPVHKHTYTLPPHIRELCPEPRPQ